MAKFEFDLDSWDFSKAASEIYLFHEYLATMEAFLESETQKLTADRQKKIESGEIQVYEDTGPEDSYESNMLDLIFSFKDTLRKSFFVSLFSFFEAELINECRKQKDKDMTILLTLNDLRGENSIDKVNVYFTKVLHSNFPSETPDWAEIQNYKTLRNCIVHAQSRLDNMKNKDDLEKLKAYIVRKKDTLSKIPTRSLSR
ncbi:MAG: hypothetical protein HY741_17845 [Chloroflexi bacterium]|nr:hypothetical protein [Chloroflexota bacterium]